MANTPSKMIPLGTVAPAFTLKDTVSDKKRTLSSLKGKKGTVIVFICNHCPFVLHINSEITKVANDYLSKGIGFIAISSNDIKKIPARFTPINETSCHKRKLSLPLSI